MTNLRLAAAVMPLAFLGGCGQWQEEQQEQENPRDARVKMGGRLVIHVNTCKVARIIAEGKGIFATCASGNWILQL